MRNVRHIWKLTNSEEERAVLRGSMLLAGLALMLAVPAAAGDQPDQEKFLDRICHRMNVVSSIYGIPEGFLARLIWQESRFNPNAISPKGAQGIAQFMPGTAKIRGLDNPFDAQAAIVASAQYLSDLHLEFGSWGLAAAGYNAGEERVRRWMAGKSWLPLETQNYVAIITGYPPETWRDLQFTAINFRLSGEKGFKAACMELPVSYSAASIHVRSEHIVPIKAWGVQVASNFSRSVALSTFRRLQQRYGSMLGKQRPSLARRINRSFGTRSRYEVQIAAGTRQEGEQLCSRLRREGAACIVVRN